MLLLFFILYCSSSVSLAQSYVSMIFRKSPPSTVFYGETVRIPVQMDVAVHWWATPGASLTCKQWDLPIGSSLQYTSGDCRQFTDDVYNKNPHPFTCYFDIVIPGNSFGTVAGALKFNTCKTSPYLDRFFFSPNFSVQVIPHGISMSTIPIQEATANIHFEYNLKSAVKFYDENVKAGYPPKGIVSPEKLDGLSFDPNNFSISGTPTRTGTYLFKVGAYNSYGTAAFVDFRIQVQVNEKDKPVFKQNYPIPSALPEQKYSLNLMELIEPQARFMQTNQISFRIDPNSIHPDWLKISSDDPTRLEGIVPSGAAGKEVEATLIASSNTGGDCLKPLTIKISVASDPAKKPVINSFELEKLAGANIYEDLSGYINDPAHDPDIKLILDKVEPAATWLRINSLNPMILEGTVPDDATGQKYLLTLRANTSTGGSSEPVTIPLQIIIDKARVPRFKSAKPLLPLVYPGQPYYYDFVANKDIYPDYRDAPYVIRFAEDFIPPDWMRLEDNKLTSDMVPPEIVNDDLEIKIVIKNIPGGLSKEYLLSLTFMN
nr:putative Ig domain-containing protein [Legionella bononiensis]